jgi:hypothetical protein
MPDNTFDMATATEATAPAESAWWDWLDPDGWPVAAYFADVSNALNSAGLGISGTDRPARDIARYTLDPAVAAGGPVDGPATVHGVSLVWSADGPARELDGPDVAEFDGRGWHYLLHGEAGECAGDLLVPSFAAPEEVADALARVLLPGPWPALLDFNEYDDPNPLSLFAHGWYRVVEEVSCGTSAHIPAEATKDGLERRLLCSRRPHDESTKHRHVTDAGGGRCLEWQ